jgi:selenium-dependent xanthine dehydrogenase
MAEFTLNGKAVSFPNSEISLLNYLRDTQHLTAAKDGCSGQGICGACTVLINGKARLSCKTKLSQIEGKEIYTLEGLQKKRKEIIAHALVEKGAVQCGFCTPGIVVKAYQLLENTPHPETAEIKKALRNHLCRCTGYVKIVEGIKLAAEYLEKDEIPNPQVFKHSIGSSIRKYKGVETALGERAFTDDLFFPDMLHAALVFSEHPRAKILKIDTAKASKAEGVVRILKAEDIPGNPITGLITQDWPLLIKEGEQSNYIGDVLAIVVAETRDQARNARQLIQVDYEVCSPVSDMHEAIKETSPQVHQGKSNVLDTTIINIGQKIEAITDQKDIVAAGVFETQRIEHAFLEVETAVAAKSHHYLHLYSQGQGIYEDRKQIAGLLNISEEEIRVTQVETGGGFGGKEDLTVQGHVALAAFLLNKAVKLKLSRDESIRMHPKRHPVYMDMKLTADANGLLKGLKLYAVGDTGAYASVGDKVLERVAGHASGGYFVPNVQIEALTVYTNNIPCGAMRGFGANQVAFALETLVDEICEKGGFDRWEFRYQNALREGLATSTGQVLGKGVGIRACLNALKDAYQNNKYVGLACAIKNSGVGNGMIDESKCKLEIVSGNSIVIHHGWTEMGQGAHNMALQTLCEETGLPPEIIDVKVDSSWDIPIGMTTSSRATALLGNAVKNAAQKLKMALEKDSLDSLSGQVFFGEYIVDWTTKPGTGVKNQITHYSYGYAAQLVILNEEGKIKEVVAAHDAGKIMNPTLFSGQIEGAVHMGLGYALRENLPMKDSLLLSDKLKDVGVLRIHETPKITVIGVEEKDEVGPYGAKGVGEIGLVPTAAAVSNAFYSFDKKRRYSLPMEWTTTDFPVAKEE